MTSTKKILRRMEDAAIKAEDSGLHPLIMDKLHKPRSVFTPGQRIIMNFAPLFINLFLPWAAFVLVGGLTSFRTMYEKPHVVWSVIGAMLVLWLVVAMAAICARRYDPNPSWYTYMALSTLAFGILGYIEGSYVADHYTRPYYEVMDQHMRGDVNAGREHGQNVMDAGIIYFAPGNGLDMHRSWHFQYKTLYCVAPIVTNSTKPETQSYDFWAVGKDCCSHTASDFRCGNWGNPETRGGIRIMDSGDVAKYRLAVQQAESIYDIVAEHPIFIEWHSDPLLEVESWNSAAFVLTLKIDAFAFVASLFLLSLAVVAYAWMGRKAPEYDTTSLRQIGREIPLYTPP